MDCPTWRHRFDAKHLADAFLCSLATVSIVVIAIAVVYVPFDRRRKSQRQRVTVLECDVPGSDATVVSLVRVHSDKMKAGAETRLTLVDLHDERSTREIHWPGSLPTCFASNHDKQRLFVGTREGEIFSLDRDRCGGRRERVFEQRGLRLEQLAITSDDKTIVIRGFRWLGSWDLENRRFNWRRTDVDCNALAITSSTTLVCGANSGEVAEFSLQTGKTIRLLARHKTNIRHIAVVNDTLVAIDGTGEVILFRRQAGSWVRRPSEKMFSGNNRLCLSADGMHAVGTSRDNTTLLCWNLDDQVAVCHMTGHAGIILNAGFLPDGSILSCGSDGTVRIWDLAARGALRLVTRITPLFAG